jgi:hypothetical protein
VLLEAAEAAAVADAVATAIAQAAVADDASPAAKRRAAALRKLLKQQMKQKAKDASKQRDPPLAGELAARFVFSNDLINETLSRKADERKEILAKRKIFRRERRLRDRPEMTVEERFFVQ